VGRQAARSAQHGDFRKWKEHDGYQGSLERLLRDLKVPRDQAFRLIIATMVSTEKTVLPKEEQQQQAFQVIL
jgi:hypothetical protein